MFKLRRPTTFQIIILGFLGVILLGALLLMLPFSVRGGRPATFHEALFTSVSAVCVTGLVVQDTAQFWSGFGQAVILCLIQIGGLGVITTAVSFMMLSGRRISLMQRSTLQESISAPKVGGIVRLTVFILKATFLIEAAGALCMLPVFLSRMGAKGIWPAVFHSISAFCNAGFDLMGQPDAPFSSLTAFLSNPVINIVIMLLIFAGGIGFLTWDDIVFHRRHLRRYSLQSKVALSTSLILILLPAVLFFFREYRGLSPGSRVLASFFQSVTTRTAGFNTSDLSAMSPVGQFAMIILMLIGGSPGSTAGGMKTTTFAVLFANTLAVFRRRADSHLFGRRIAGTVIQNASAILLLYVVLFAASAAIISAVDHLPLFTCMFETASAIGTVGLTLGITPHLSLISHCILMMLMFFGRVGGLTLIYAAFSGTDKSASRLPVGMITIG